MPNTSAISSFVPASFNPADFASIEPLGQWLIDRPLNTADDLQQWLADLSALLCAIYERRSRVNIEYSCHTDVPEKEQAYMHFVEHIQPKLAPLMFKLQQRYVQSAARTPLEADPSFKQLGREWDADVSIFREANVPLQTELSKLNSEYDKLCGAMLVEFDGKTQTLQQMGRYLEEPDRAIREQAWRLIADRRLADRDKGDDIYDRMIALRHQIAQNAGFDDFRGYTWKAMQRFDYTPESCVAFADAIEQAVMPLVEKLTVARQAALKLEKLRPWDTAVDPRNRPALKPFDPANVPVFVEKTRQIFNRVDPKLGEQFGKLQFERNLDLDSRKGKRPGGYQASLELSKEPFIFMNSAGVQRDVETMLHEGGHAFHYLAAVAKQPLIYFRHSPLEFAEVASMSMELLGGPHLDLFYTNQADHQRALRTHLEGIVKFFPWMATIDQFQHWLYANPNHTRDQRTAHWLSLMQRFGGKHIDWTGCEAARESLWQRQLHLYHVPFYYVEYGIAQLGALQVWQNYRKDPRKALSQLLDAFALGGSRPLPELFKAAGIRFDFTAATITPLMNAIGEELAKLPE